MDDTILLHVAAIFNDDLSPVATECSAGPDITIFPDDYISSYSRLLVNKTAFMNDGDIFFELVNQISDLSVRNHSPLNRAPRC